MITLRLIEDLDTDYEVFRHFYPAHKWPEVPKPIFQAGMGLVAEEDGRILAATVVLTASGGVLAMMEFTVTNPNNTPMTSARAINHLLDFASQECTKRGYQALFTCSRLPALGRVFERNGYMKTDTEVTNYLKILKPETK